MMLHSNVLLKITMEEVQHAQIGDMHNNTALRLMNPSTKNLQRKSLHLSKILSYAQDFPTSVPKGKPQIN